MWTLLHRREDGSFVIMLNGMPYHVVRNDPLHAEVNAAAEGVDLPPEPEPPPVVISPAPEPTRAELMAKLQKIQAQIEALAG